MKLKFHINEISLRKHTYHITNRRIPVDRAIKQIDIIGVLKTVMHYGYSGISRETNL